MENSNSSTVVSPTSPGYPTEKHLLVRGIVMVVCSLSMIGAIFVILSYACFKSLRTQARQILVNLSLMDLGIGVANFTGAAVNFDQYYKDMPNGTALIGTHAMDALCKTQAFVAHFTTYSSVVWTTSLAVYMYSLVFLNIRGTRLYLPACYALCYGLGIGLTVWLILTSRLGHSPYNSSGWCSLIIVSPGSKKVDMMAAVFGYDLWIYLTFFVCVVIYPTLILQMNIKFKSAIQLVGTRKFWKKALEYLNFKLLLIPIAFLLLRIWSCAVNIVFVYCGVDPDSLPHWLSLFLIIMSFHASENKHVVKYQLLVQYTSCFMIEWYWLFSMHATKPTIIIFIEGIGDSGQGLANGLIFVFLTSGVRRKFFCRCFKKLGAINYTSEAERLVLRNENLDDEARTSPNSVVTPTSSLLT